MTYSYAVKSELCSVEDNTNCDIIAETFGILMFSTVFNTHEIRITTSNPLICARIVKLIMNGFGICVIPNLQNKKYTIQILDSKSIMNILGGFGIDATNNLSIRLNRALVEEECCKSAFLRGAFLMSGSASPPEKSYHLELVTSHYNLSREMMALLMDMEFEPKVIIRKSNYVIYFKYSEGIEDFLTKIGAPINAMRMMTAKVEKEVRNNVNRQVNCEAANISKTMDASLTQIEAIENIKKTIGLNSLPEDLRTVAQARLEYPEMSLSQLSDTFNPPIRKATLNYRLKKLILLGQKGENQ